jgi:hypothetical protein
MIRHGNSNKASDVSYLVLLKLYKQSPLESFDKCFVRFVAYPNHMHKQIIVKKNNLLWEKKKKEKKKYPKHSETATESDVSGEEHKLWFI